MRAERDALPLAAGQVDAVGVRLGEHGVEVGEIVGARLAQRFFDRGVGRAARRDVDAQRSLVAHEVLEHRGDARAPLVEVELPQVDAVDLDAARLRVVEAAQQLCEGGLARAVHADDRQRRPGGNDEVEAVRAQVARSGRYAKVTSRNRISRAGIAAAATAVARAPD